MSKWFVWRNAMVNRYVILIIWCSYFCFFKLQLYLFDKIRGSFTKAQSVNYTKTAIRRFHVEVFEC